MTTKSAADQEPKVPAVMPIGPLIRIQTFHVQEIQTFHVQESSRYLRWRKSIVAELGLPARSDSGSADPEFPGALFSVRELNSGLAIVRRRLKGIESSLTSRRAIATVVAALLLTVQLIAAAHVHPGMLIKSVSDGARAGAAEIACPVCIFHAFTATAAADVFMLVVPFLAEAFVVTAIRSRLLCTPKSQLFGRAPPASA